MLAFIFLSLFHPIPVQISSRAECLNQTNGYPKAKFRKFNTQTEANEFVKTEGKANFSNEATTSSIKTNVAAKTASFVVEHMRHPDLINLTNSSSTALLKQDKSSVISQKLEKFIEETNKRFNEFSARLEALEALNFSM